MGNDAPFFSNVSDRERFRAAIEAFDRLNSQDPNTEIVEGTEQPRELVYAQRLCDWVMRLAPDASEDLRLAARSQHLCRWMVTRAKYPFTKAGYHQWKTDLKRFHAARSAEVLRESGYPSETINRVSDLNLKKHFPHDAETRVLEDALCLLFLEHQFGPLALKLDDSKTVNAVKKSWEKMTEKARNLALQLPYSDKERAIIEQALA